MCQIIFILIIFNLLKAFLIDHFTTENEQTFRKQIMHSPVESDRNSAVRFKKTDGGVDADIQ